MSLPGSMFSSSSVSFTVSVSQSVAIWGTEVSVSCKVTPWPYGAGVQWMLNSSPFVPLTGIPSVEGVVKERATEKLTGNWTCMIGYKGKQGRASATLTVKGKPQKDLETDLWLSFFTADVLIILSFISPFLSGIIQPSKDNTKVYAAVGSEVTLPCVFSSGLIPSSSAWEKLKPGSGFNKPAPGRLPASFSPSSPSTQPSLDNSASLREVGFEDEGRYRCSGIVEGQRLTRNIQLVVAKSKLPRIKLVKYSTLVVIYFFTAINNTFHCLVFLSVESSITSKKKGSMALTCKLTDTSEVTDYEWVHVVYDNNGTQSFESIQKGKTLSISKVSEENRGEWTCRFSGKEGILGNVTYQVQLMSKLLQYVTNQYTQIYKCTGWMDEHIKCHFVPLCNCFYFVFPCRWTEWTKIIKSLT